MLFIKLTYLTLFWTIDILLYLRLNTLVIKTNYWLIVSFIIWLAIGLLHLPVLHFTFLMRLKDYLTMSATVIQLLVGYFLLAYSVKRVQRLNLSENLEDQATWFIRAILMRVLFIFIAFAHLLWALGGPLG